MKTVARVYFIGEKYYPTHGESRKLRSEDAYLTIDVARKVLRKKTADMVKHNEYYLVSQTAESATLENNGNILRYYIETVNVKGE